MKIEICTAYIVTETKKHRLTKSIAKQFPCLSASSRSDAMTQGQAVPSPICKTKGSTLGQGMFSWLYLIEHDGGYAWQPAFVVRESFAQQILDRGGMVDRPEDVLTVVL